MAQQFSEIKWSDDGTNLRSLLLMVLQRLSDPAMPVQIEASKASILAELIICQHHPP
jgi:hypothetical protein